MLTNYPNNLLRHLILVVQRCLVSVDLRLSANCHFEIKI